MGERARLRPSLRRCSHRRNWKPEDGGHVQHGDDAGYLERLAAVDAKHPATGDGAADDAAMQQAGVGVFAGIASLPGDLCQAIDTIYGLADNGGNAIHGVAPG